MKQKFDYVWNVRTLLMVLLLLVPIAGFTQNGTVKGTVVDSEGEPVIGATVTEKGKWCYYQFGWRLYFDVIRDREKNHCNLYRYAY